MPSFMGKDGKPRFSMNPQAGRALYGGNQGGGAAAAAQDPSSGSQTDDGSTGQGEVDSVGIHKGGHEEGTPPPTPQTQFHTIAKRHDPVTGMESVEIQNHNDFESADQHAKQLLGQSDASDGSDISDSGGENGESDLSDNGAQ